ncbi:hypothetical protein VIBNISFn118_100028 [Vibrio nigripulchritudo SFn118]|nr:hypothetical protein VIBNISFn118_100028 [Vibrio nigripulchritudo SFn118]
MSYLNNAAEYSLDNQRSILSSSSLLFLECLCPSSWISCSFKSARTSKSSFVAVNISIAHPYKNILMLVELLLSKKVRVQYNSEYPYHSHWLSSNFLAIIYSRNIDLI